MHASCKKWNPNFRIGKYFLLSLCASMFGSSAFGSVWPTEGGTGGRVIVVTNLNDDGPGSLREALAVDEPRIIRFAVAGEIWLEKVIRVGKPYITIEGASAPSPGITLLGEPFRIATHDVIVRDIRVRAGARSFGSDPDNRDCLQIIGDANTTYNILVENCSFAWSIDENVQLWGAGIHDVAIRRCIIAEALKNSLHTKGDHSAGMIVGQGVTDVLVEQNLFAHNSFRNPVVTAGASAVVVNNLIYNPGFNAFHMYGHEGYGPNRADVIGNMVVAGPDTRPRLAIFHNASGFFPGSRVHLDGNSAVGTVTFDTAERPPNWTSDMPSPFSPEPVMTLPVTLKPLPASTVEQLVLSTAGARTDDRDCVDSRIIREVETRTGQIRNFPEDERLLPSPR